MKKLSFGLLLGLICIVGGGQVARATTVKSFAFEGICETAQTIVHVRCLERKSMRFANRDGIYTQTRFEVLEVVKGQIGSELVLVLPGGQWDGQHLQVPGVPQFVVDEETVLFLSEPDDFGSPWPVGLGQGCYGVTEKDGESRHVSLAGDHTPLPPGVRNKPAVRSQMALRDFVSVVQGVLKMSTDNTEERQ